MPGCTECNVQTAAVSRVYDCVYVLAYIVHFYSLLASQSGSFSTQQVNMEWYIILFDHHYA